MPTAGKRNPKVAHGPTVNAIKRAKYEAKQERQRQALTQQKQSSAHPWVSWLNVNGREEYAAYVTTEDVRDIRDLRRGKGTSSDNDDVRITRLRRVAEWIEPFFDLKETPKAGSETERLFVSEGTEAVRMMVRHSELGAASAKTKNSSHAEPESPPPLRLVSILSKPATFFDSPTHLLGDIQLRHFSTGSSVTPPFKIIIANEEALSEIAGFKIARGAMACGVIPSYMHEHGYAWLKRLLLRGSTQLPSTIDTAQQPQKPIRRILALDAISNAANVGSILRTAAAFSVDAVIFSDDSCDAWYRQSVRVSMGHVVSVNMLRVADWKRGRAQENQDDDDHKSSGLAGVLRWMREQMNIACYAAVVDDGDRDNTKNFPPLVTLEADQECGSRSWCCVLGNEGTGIRDEVIQECDKRVKIGMAMGVDSLSLPIAAGILMHGLSSRSRSC